MSLGLLRGRRAPVRLGFFASALAALTATPLAAASAPAAPRPALWVVQDADTTIYLFGTFHTLDERRDWLTPQVAQAFGSAGELVLETVVPKTRAEIEAAAKGTEKSAYLTGASRVIAAGRTKGMSTDNGADHVLRELADEAGKPVSGLEEFGAQLRTLARIKAVPVPASAMAAPAPAATVTLDQLLAAWKSGDCGAFSAMLSGFKSRSPEAYEALIAGRNRAWADWVRTRLDTPGTVFVAVGTGHLAGEDSVQMRLAQAGLLARRIG